MENTIKKAKETFPDKHFIIMTGTKTEQDIAYKKLENIVDFITYFPLDFPIFINRMIKKLNPKAVFIMETELWPNFAYITKKKNIPTFIINARISDRTFNSYKKLKFIFKF
jgi:3-deoxy-D-manno-octulosonic-acid transferase